MSTTSPAPRNSFQPTCSAETLNEARTDYVTFAKVAGSVASALKDLADDPKGSEQQSAAAMDIRASVLARLADETKQFVEKLIHCREQPQGSLARQI